MQRCAHDKMSVWRP